MTYKKVRTTGLSLPVYNFVQSLPPTLQGITPWACLKPFNYDRYSLSESLVFAARIIICLLLKSNTVLKTVPSWDQPVGPNKFYKKKKKYACTLIRIVFEFESFETQKQWIGSILYRACAVWCLQSQHGRSQLFEYLWAWGTFLSRYSENCTQDYSALTSPTLWPHLNNA